MIRSTHLYPWHRLTRDYEYTFCIFFQHLKCWLYYIRVRVHEMSKDGEPFILRTQALIFVSIFYGLESTSTFCGLCCILYIQVLINQSVYPVCNSEFKHDDLIKLLQWCTGYMLHISIWTYQPGQNHVFSEMRERAHDTPVVNIHTIFVDFLSHNSWMKNLNFTKKYIYRP
jgi:hypothetical protein